MPTCGQRHAAASRRQSTPRRISLGLPVFNFIDTSPVNGRWCIFYILHGIGLNLLHLLVELFDDAVDLLNSLSGLPDSFLVSLGLSDSVSLLLGLFIHLGEPCLISHRTGGLRAATVSVGFFILVEVVNVFQLLFDLEVV